MKDLTSSVYTFEKLISGNYLYVDKTEYIWKLIQPSSGIYFLSRPRRFGKSLTLSTLKAVFQGRDDLFKGLAIASKGYNWEKHPVIHLDMGNCNAKNANELENFIADIIEDCAKGFGIKLRGQSSATRFGFLIADVAAAAGANAVILVDEYDKPLLGTLMTTEATACRDVLKGFYSSIKKCESLERFVFITGVSKFSHVSIFSDLNNLNDISMNADYATMLGYTQAELESCFADRIADGAQKSGLPVPELLAQIKSWYDGYRFEETSESVYNPVSLAQFFINNCKFNNYWFSTGTPTFLLDLIKSSRFDFEKALTRPVSAIAFQAFEIGRIDPLALLLQTGYLTIKDSFKEFNATLYNLDFPNFEVRSSFDTYLLNTYTDIPKDDLELIALSLARNVRGGDVDGFMDDLKSFLKKIPYGIQLADEKYYQTIIFLVFLLLGIHVEAESQTSDGRIDAVASYGEWTYVFEFKLNQSAEIALDQIMRKEYFRKYSHSGKRVVVIGANLDSETRQISDWKQQEVNK
jgi:hypothetical protein